MQLNVSIRERIATYNPPEPDYLYVCGNGGDTVQFDFDDEWQGKDPKTARFIGDAGYTDVEFTGDTCEIPVFKDSSVFTVGVYIGEPAEEGEDIMASTGAIVPCNISIRYSGFKPSPSTGQNYTNEARGYAESAKDSAEIAQEAAENIEQYKGLELIGKFYNPFTKDEYSDDYFVDQDFVDALLLAKVAFLRFDGMERKPLVWSIQDNGSWNESNVDFSLYAYSVATLGECLTDNGLTEYWIELYR